MTLEEIFEYVIRNGDTVLDVGGHVGNVAGFMARCAGPNGKVFSFEPNPEKFKVLKARAEKVPSLAAFNYAVSNSSSPVTLYYGLTGQSDQASTICAELATQERLGEEIRSVEVPAITLDAFCAERRLAPAVIKIDVEGAEPLVLEGAAAVLETKPVLIFEMGVVKTLPGHLAGLRARGYKLYIIDMHRFVGEPPSWDRIVNTENRALRNCILPFTDAAAESLAPFVANVLAVVPGKHAERLAGLREMELTEASRLFADPKLSLSRKIKRLAKRALIPAAFEERYPGTVAGLKRLVNRIL